MIGGPVGFSEGGHATDIKVQEVRQFIADGTRVVDTVVIDRLPDEVQAYRNAGIQVISLDEDECL